MSDLLLEGLTLMLIGMGTVFVFLALLVVTLTLTSNLILKFWPEAEATDSHDTAASDNGEVIAAITAAIHQHRNR
ncbi:OadG family protein [Pleionea sp. CnH1-48]|uniref:OadG family protein n=1 Tax=Pleionea sp. CnH1-48 TaxID=2954494 RepID=UPI002097A49A|nr:OadG family transporter subunit [Pleionea sp. CnH1-48]MCO7224199.1 OadG family transporter subunit [Pleionea sp. CnH1-48]